MNYIISDTILESLKNAQTLQEVAILVNEVHKPAHRDARMYALNEDSSQAEIIETFAKLHDYINTRFLWVKYKDGANREFDRAYESLGAVIRAIEFQGVLR